MTSYSSIPRPCDRKKAYLYFKQTISNSFEFKYPKNSQNTIRTLLLASIDNRYIEGCAQNLHLCGQTIRNHLKQQNPQQLLQLNQHIIHEMHKKGALTKPLTMAVDWHDIMYYGNPSSQGVVGAVRKNGSNHAYRFATISVLVNKERLTLAVVPMLDKCILGHVKQLLDSVFELGLSIKLLLFDRGYYSVDLLNYLQSAGIKYIMHIPWFGRPLKAMEDRFYTTTTHNRRSNRQASFRLVTLRQKDKLLVFATNTLFKPRRLRKLFRKRWGIETSYRVIGMFLAKTTSKLYRVRVLYFFLAVVLYNLWVMWNFRRRFVVSVYSLLHAMRLCLVLSWLPDAEAGG